MLRLVVAAPVLMFLAAGCGKSDTVPVTGTLTVNGKPADQAEVMFNPKHGRMAIGVTDSSGRFALSTASPSDGATPGEYVVTLGEYYPPGKAPPLPPKGGLLPSRFPPKYGDPSQSPLSVIVTREGPNDFPLEVKK